MHMEIIVVKNPRNMLLTPTTTILPFFFFWTLTTNCSRTDPVESYVQKLFVYPSLSVIVILVGPFEVMILSMFF